MLVDIAPQMKINTQGFMAAYCFPTGIKHQSGNTVHNTSRSSLKKRPLSFTEATYIS